MKHISVRVSRLIVVAVCVSLCVLVVVLMACSSQQVKERVSDGEMIENVQDHSQLDESPSSVESASSAQGASASAESPSGELDENLPGEGDDSDGETTPSSALSAADSDRNDSVRSTGHEIDGFVALDQSPELPNGCEVTSLAAVLNYYGYNIDKCTLSDAYLPKAPVGQANFYREFVGNPRNSDAYGCYSPVIESTANSYLASAGSSMRARDISGSSPDELYAHIDADQPVIVWATRYMEPGYYSVTWNVNGTPLTWYTPEHCLVLTGYDTTTRNVSLADPLEGAIMSYDMDLFEQRYAELHNQAVVIS